MIAIYATKFFYRKSEFNEHIRQERDWEKFTEHLEMIVATKVNGFSQVKHGKFFQPLNNVLFRGLLQVNGSHIANAQFSLISLPVNRLGILRGGRDKSICGIILWHSPKINFNEAIIFISEDLCFIDVFRERITEVLKIETEYSKQHYGF